MAMKNMLICGACLAMNVKMYNLQILPLFFTYSELTGIKDVSDNPYICYECATRLQKCKEFRSNCITARGILQSELATKEDIQRERSIKCLESPLKLTVCQIIDYNIKINELDDTKIPIEASDDEFSDSEKYNTIISEVCHITSEQTLAAEKVTSSELINETFPCNKNNKIVEKLNFQDIKSESLLKLKNKSKMIKKTLLKVKPNKRSKFDEKSFDDYAIVTTMTSEDAKKEVELRKESLNYKRSQFKCHLCYRGYEAPNTYDNHMKRHSLASGKYECEFCFVRFLTSHSCRCHMFKSHKLKISCKMCPHVCFSSTQARSHMRSHKGIKYQCDLCQESFNFPHSLLGHKRIKHITDCVCALCGNTFVNDRGLKAHRALMHKQDTNDKKGPQCAECDVHFATELAWKRHLVLSSKHEVSFGCETCGETFDNDEKLKIHLKTHDFTKTTSIDITCSICREQIYDLTKYKKHLKSVHPESVITKRYVTEEKKMLCVCEVCGKKLWTQASYVEHKRLHTGERPYKCDVCEKTFSYLGSFTAHKMSHDANRAFKCDICEKIVKSKFILKKHIKSTHLNVRPHSCDVCGKAFPNRCEVKYHKQHVHENMPWPKRDRSKRNKAKKDS